MRVVSKWNHELGPTEREMVGSLSGGMAVGAFIATQGDLYFVQPIGAPELLAEDCEERNYFLSRFESDAAAEFRRMRADRLDTSDTTV